MTVLLSPSPPAQPPPPQPTPTPTPTLDNPQVNKEVNVLPVSGTVKIKRKGTNRYVDLKAGEQIPNGSSVDARKGRVTIVAAQSGTKLERADFYSGLFTVSQTRRLTTVTLSEQLDCSRKARAAQKKKPKSRKLWGDGKGKFRTKGRYAAATVRGTRWLVTDTCRTTKVTVRQGSVSVRDEVRKRTVVVRKGKSYTARARR
jgi:ferric-dicitrate binding protein FerR (iron transport regulator)